MNQEVSSSDGSETISNDADFDFLQPTKPDPKNEEVWCKISPDGKLEIFEWDFVEKTAKEFDSLAPFTEKTNGQIICKLAVLIREQTLQRAAYLLSKYAESPANTSVVMISDPLGDDL